MDSANITHNNGYADTFLKKQKDRTVLMEISEKCLKSLPPGRFVRFEENLLVWEWNDDGCDDVVFGHFDPDTGKCVKHRTLEQLEKGE